MSTDNKYLIDAVGSNKKVITYKKSKAKEQKLNTNSFAAMDTKSFNSKIGVITNIASNMIAMLSHYKENTREHKELKKRIKLLRFHQGSAIDSTKGDIFIPPPKHWTKRQKFIEITSNMTEEDIRDVEKKNKEIAFNNKITVDKKAYFFKYIYKSLDQEYEDYIVAQKILCRENWNCKISDITSNKERPPEHKTFLYNYYRYMPLFKNNCTMNTLAFYIEDMELQNKWIKTQKTFNYTVLFSRPIVESDMNSIVKIKNIFANAYKTYERRLLSLNTDEYVDVDVDSIKSLEIDIFRSSERLLKKELESVTLNKEDLANYFAYVMYTYYKNTAMTWLWSICGEQLIKNMQSNCDTSYKIILDDNGKEYMGRHYSMAENGVLDDYT